MITVEEGRKAADEIAAMLKEMTAEQKVRVRDVLAGTMLIPVPKEDSNKAS